MKKKKTIFVLEAITTRSWRYPHRRAYRNTIGYFTTKERAECALAGFVHEEEMYEQETPRRDWDLQHVGYILYERLVDKHDMGDYGRLWNMSVRSYTPDGKLWDECLTPDDGLTEYKGRTAEQIRFHRGDIVEVVEDDWAELCIVEQPPRDTAWCAEKKASMKANYGYSVMLDYSDDTYLVDSLGEGDTHSHPMCFEVFPPSKPVSEEMAQKLRAKLEEIDEMQRKYEDEI